MKRKHSRTKLSALTLLTAFVVFTVLLKTVDVQPIGPENTKVGFAVINQAVLQKIGVHTNWYTITDWLGILPILFALYFAAIGLYQIISQRSIRKVDSEILILGLFYVTLIAVYLFFEKFIINHRPVMISKVPEASYPSSHTMITLCIMATGAKQMRILYPLRKKLCFCTDTAAVLISTITILGRLYSGVHWFTDIVGGLLISSALIAFYCALIEFADKEKSKRN